jgi:hypothetical protein
MARRPCKAAHYCGTLSPRRFTRQGKRVFHLCGQGRPCESVARNAASQLAPLSATHAARASRCSTPTAQCQRRASTPPPRPGDGTATPGRPPPARPRRPIRTREGLRWHRHRASEGGIWERSDETSYQETDSSTPIALPQGEEGRTSALNLPVVSRLLEFHDIKESCHAPRHVSRLRRPARPRPARVQTDTGVIARPRRRPRRPVAGGRPRLLSRPEPLR